MRKRILSFALLLTLVLGFVAVTPTLVLANDRINVTIDGQAVVFPDQQPVIIDGRTLVPAAGVFQTLGFDVVWNRDTRQAILTRANDVIVITIDSAAFTVNGANHTLDVPAQIIGGRTMLPLRAVLESVGYNLNWNRATQTVVITSAGSQTPPAAISATLPNRRLTDGERQAWINAYNANGGPTEFELEVIRLINAIRAEHGLVQLQQDRILGMATRFYAQTLDNLGLPFGHDEGPYGGSEGTVAAFGGGWNTANITTFSLTPQSAVDSWMNSLVHRDNLLNTDSRFIGVGKYGDFVYMLSHWESNES